MDIKEYISSGVIETYVLGMATDEEIHVLKELCSKYPEVQQALDEAEATMGRLALDGQEQPPAALKSAILDTLVNEGLVDGFMQKPVDDDFQVRKSTNWYALMAAACALLLVIGVIFHINTVKELKSKLSVLTARERNLLVENINFREQLINKEEEIMITARASVSKYNLAGIPGHEHSSATLYWDKVTKEVFLLPQNLSVLPMGKQYQLWAIVDGKPVDAGVYTKDNFTVLQKMRSTERAEMFAITIEKQGGAEQPTLDQMVVAVKL